MKPHWRALMRRFWLKPIYTLRSNSSDTSDIKAEVTRQFADINGETQVYGSYVMERRAEVYTDFKLDIQGVIPVILL